MVIQVPHLGFLGRPSFSQIVPLREEHGVDILLHRRKIKSKLHEAISTTCRAPCESLVCRIISVPVPDQRFVVGIGVALQTHMLAELLAPAAGCAALHGTRDNGCLLSDMHFIFDDAMVEMRVSAVSSIALLDLSCRVRELRQETGAVDAFAMAFHGDVKYRRTPLFVQELIHIIRPRPVLYAVRVDKRRLRSERTKSHLARERLFDVVELAALVAHNPVAGIPFQHV